LDKVERFREAARLFREKLGDFASAAASLEEALEARPRDLALLRDVIALKGEAGDPRGAEAVIDRALAQAEWRPEERGALLAARAGFRAALDRDEEALADLEEAHALGSADRLHVADQLERLEEQKWSRGDRDEARTLTLRWVGMVSGFDDRQDRAREKLIELLRADARDRDALRALAALEERAEDWDGASATYRRLVSLEEGDAVVDTALRLADACARAGRFGDARSGLERARAMAPENADLRARLEALYAETGAFRELADLQIADANAALDVAGRFGHLVRAGAILVEHAGDAEAATPLLEEAYTLRPGDFECAAVLADAYTLAGRLDAATDLITQAVAAHRGRRSRELSPLYHRLARVSRARGDRPSEMAWLSSALDMDAHNGPVASELAAVALEGGQLEVAVRALRAITMMKSPGPMTRAHAYHWLGHIAQQQGDVKRAVVMLKRAVDEDPSLDDARAMLDALSAEGA
jgi:tetratricopeptide (TPR) repeat protein